MPEAVGDKPCTYIGGSIFRWDPWWGMARIEAKSALLI